MADQIATTRILDAAGQLFADIGLDGTTMTMIAIEAGCSRGTLYNHFESRDVLRRAYFQRVALAVAIETAARVERFDDPEERLVETVLHTVEVVRADPLLIARFTSGEARNGVSMTQGSDLLDGIASVFTTGDDGDEASVLRARWMVRVIVSLLLMPGRDRAEEAMLVRTFALPVLRPPVAVPAPAECT